MRGRGDAEAAPLARWGRQRCALDPAACRFDAVEAFGKAVRADAAAAEPRVAGGDGVATAQGDGIDAQPAGDLIDLLLAAELHLRLAERLSKLIDAMHSKIVELEAEIQELEGEIRELKRNRN